VPLYFIVQSFPLLYVLLGLGYIDTAFVYKLLNRESVRDHIGDLPTCEVQHYCTTAYNRSAQEQVTNHGGNPGGAGGISARAEEAQ
jgi:hypothetical protein